MLKIHTFYILFRRDGTLDRFETAKMKIRYWLKLWDTAAGQYRSRNVHTTDDVNCQMHKFTR